MVDLAVGITAQQKRDREAYNARKKKNSTASITLLSSMENDIMHEFRKYKMASEMQVALKEQFGVTFFAKVRQLTNKFDTYKKCPNHNMKQHLQEITSTVNESKMQL